MSLVDKLSKGLGKAAKKGAKSVKDAAKAEIERKKKVRAAKKDAYQKERLKLAKQKGKQKAREKTQDRKIIDMDKDLL